MSGYDKRVKVGVDADAAVDGAINKLLNLKNIADSLDGKKSKISAELDIDTSELDKLKNIKIAIDTTLDIGKTLPKETQKALREQAKQIQKIIDRYVDTSTPTYKTVPGNSLTTREQTAVINKFNKAGINANGDQFKQALEARRTEISLKNKVEQLSKLIQEHGNTSDLSILRQMDVLSKQIQHEKELYAKQREQLDVDTRNAITSTHTLLPPDPKNPNQKRDANYQKMGTEAKPVIEQGKALAYLENGGIALYQVAKSGENVTSTFSDVADAAKILETQLDQSLKQIKKRSDKSLLEKGDGPQALKNARGEVTKVTSRESKKVSRTLRDDYTTFLYKLASEEWSDQDDLDLEKLSRVKKGKFIGAYLSAKKYGLKLNDYGVKDEKNVYEQLMDKIIESDPTGTYQEIRDTIESELESTIVQNIEKTAKKKTVTTTSKKKSTSIKKKSTGTSANKSKPSIEQKTEKTADAVETAADQVNNAVGSATGNAVENMNQVADSAEKLAEQTKDTARAQEEAVKVDKGIQKEEEKVPKDKVESKPEPKENNISDNAPSISVESENPGHITFNPNDLEIVSDFISDNRRTSVYRDEKVGRLYTRNLIKDGNGNWIESNNKKNNYDALEKEAVKTEKELMTERENLKDEQAKSEGNRSQAKIDASTETIKRLKGRMRNLRTIAEAYSTEDPYHYSTTQFDNAIQRGIEQHKIDMKERSDRRTEKSPAIVEEYAHAVAQAKELDQVNKSILDTQKQIDDKSNVGVDRVKLNQDLVDLKEQKKELESNLADFKSKNFVEANKGILEANGKDITAFDDAMRKAEKSGSKLKAYNYDQIISQYTDLMNGLSVLEQKNRELSSAKSKGVSEDLIKSLEDEISEKKKNLGDVDAFIESNKDFLGDDRVNAFNTQKSKLNQAEANVNLVDFNNTYDRAIGKLGDLKQAYIDLYNIQANGASGKYSKDELAERLTAQSEKIKSLRSDVEGFYKDIYLYGKNQKDSTFKLNPQKIKEYEKAFSDVDDYASYSGKGNNIIELMKKAYNNKRNNENNILSLAAKDNSSADIAMKRILGENYTAAYTSTRKQVESIFGKDVAERAISDIRDRANLKQDDIVSNNMKAFTGQIDSYIEKVEKAGRASVAFKDDFKKIASAVNEAQNVFSQNRNPDGIEKYTDEMQKQMATFQSTKDYYENGLGKNELDYTEQLNKLVKFSNSGSKITEYKDKITTFVNTYNEIINKLSGKEINTEEAQTQIQNLVKQMQEFQKTSSGFEKTNSKGTIYENSLYSVKDVEDATNALRQYASQLGLTNEVSSSINKSTGSVTMTFKDASDNLVTLTGNIEKANDSLRVMEKYSSKNASSGFKSLSDSLKGLVKGNFTSALGDIANAVGSIQIMQQTMQQMREGFSTFMDYDKALTTISYTMDMNKQQLASLGSSAVDMAKDLSMSLENTMDIYQIYANMNTTSQEIQETAKPTAILSNLSGVDASTAADQVQGILQQFHMLEDGSTSAADASMHIVDVLDKISGNVGIDYAKGIKVISDAVQASGQVAYDAGMTYEQLAAISAKVAERTREDGSSIGNALKTNNCLYVQKCA